ncbi:FmdB family zinc ribbon protein [Haladaptatus cibarius]|uniref:hypothetical protein n=1 Tax=Haladaptatus cibarius TaxID=453847 RepID=UPI00130E4E6C|nr:hypothetical protein [Haladaptatus cibarius]
MNYLVVTFEPADMGLMRRLGVGSESESDSNDPYECRGCETSFTVRYQVCPECGGYTIERDDWD